MRSLKQIGMMMALLCMVFSSGVFADENAYKGDEEPQWRGLLYVLVKHHQQQEYSRQLGKGYKPE